MKIKLKVYDTDMNTVKKECVAHTVKVPFGVIRKLMKIFNVNNLEDTAQILNVIMSSWDSVIETLHNVFPEVQEEEWDYVDTKEMVQVIFQLLKTSFTDILTIPTDSKNV